ncbi:hypothetical protein BS47DRAFT_1358777 [Hydnum rufescens UP504]|uniref:Uncharacterized protein n=1 Tax=Hydnum rufescens UP504 TaxID=1448309 RepID=A0A9P6B788_9AGAM|nr:hypothetical protein BS47DRAFT_1358777 [Hydnum rufescens UP504]
MATLVHYKRWEAKKGTRGKYVRLKAIALNAESWDCEQSGAVVSFHPKHSFYYSTFFVVTFVPAWATLPQPTGFDALECAYELADPVIFPPGAKQYIRSVVCPTPPPISSPVLLQDPCMVDGWQVTSQGIISHKRQLFPEGNTMRHEQEFITVPHWSLSPEVVGSEAKDESDGEEASPPVSPRLLYPPGTIVSNSMVWVTEADTQAEVCGENCVARNQRKKQKKVQNKKAWEERLEREWHSHTSTAIQPDKEALDAWNAPSIYDSVDNSNTLDPLPSKHERVSETIRKSMSAPPSGLTSPPAQHQCTSDKGASVKKSSLEASGSTGGSALDPAPLLPLPAQPPSEHPDRGSRICYNHHDALYNSVTDDRLQEGCMIRDEGRAQEKHCREVEEFSPSHKLPLPQPSVNEASDVDSCVSWGAVVGALNEISQVETESYVTQGTLEEAVALSYMGHSIPPFPTIPSNLWYGRHADMCEQLSTTGCLFHQVQVRMTAVHTHNFPQYLGEVDSQAPLNVYGPHAMNERNLQRLDFQHGPVASSLLAPHYAFVVPQPPFSIIPEPESSDLIYNSSSPALCRVNNGWIANRAGPRSTFGHILGIASTMVNHLHAPSDHSFSTLDESSKRAQSADAELHRLTVFTMFDDIQNMILYMERTISLSLAVVCMSVLIAIDVCALLGGFDYPIWPVQRECAGSLFFVGGTIGMQTENLHVEFRHFLQTLERWGIRHWCMELDKAGSRFEMDLHSTPTEDVQAEENHQSFLFQQMDSTGNRKRTAWVTCEKRTTYVPFLIPPPPGPNWSWDVLLQENLATLTPFPMGNHLPAQQALVFVPSSYHEQGKMVPSSLGIEAEMLNISGSLLSMDNERTPKVSPDLWYSLVVKPFMTEIALLSMVEVVQSRGAEGWKQTQLGKSGFSLDSFSSPILAETILEEALSLQRLKILLSLLADFNASFLQPVYPTRSGPYVKLLHFIASRVEFAAQSNSMQCDVIPQAQQEKLNILQLTEAIGYKLDTKQFFIDWDPSSPTPLFIPSLSTLEANQAQSEERVKNLKTSKAKHKGAKEKIVDTNVSNKPTATKRQKQDPPCMPRQEIPVEERGTSGSTTTAVPAQATHANTKASEPASGGPVSSAQKKAHKVPPVHLPRQFEGDEEEQDVFDCHRKGAKGLVDASPLSPITTTAVSKPSKSKSNVVTYAKHHNPASTQEVTTMEDKAEGEGDEEQWDRPSMAGTAKDPRPTDCPSPTLPRGSYTAITPGPSDDVHDVEASLLDRELEEEVGDMSSPGLLSEGLGLSDQEIQEGSHEGSQPVVVSLAPRVNDEGRETSAEGILGLNPEATALEFPSPTHLMRNLKTSRNKDVQRCITKERAVLPNSPSPTGNQPCNFLAPKNTKNTAVQGAESSEGDSTEDDEDQQDNPEPQEDAAGDVSEAHDPPSEYLTKDQEKAVHTLFWTLVEDIAKTKAKDLNVTASAVFRVLGDMFSKESHRDNIWNCFQTVFRAQNPDIKDSEAIHDSYKEETKKAKDCGGKAGLSKWHVKIKEAAESLQAYVLSNLCATYVECAEPPSEDPVVEWEWVKKRINGSQGSNHAVQVALRTAASKAWCEVINNALGMDNEKAVLSRIGNQLYTGWDKEVFVITNFPDNVPLEKMESLGTTQRWSLLQACVVGLLEKVHGKEGWLKDYDDEGLVITVSGKALFTVGQTKVFQKEKAAMAKGKGKEKHSGAESPTTYLKRTHTKAQTSTAASNPPETGESEEGDEDEEE